jgi:hypothetical protein
MDGEELPSVATPPPGTVSGCGESGVLLIEELEVGGGASGVGWAAGGEGGGV